MPKSDGSDYNLPAQFLRVCKQRMRSVKVTDSMSGEMTGADLLLRTLVLRRLFLRHVLKPDERFVGVLLPPSNGAIMANMALSLSRRTAVNLNYTVTSEVMNACIKQAGIAHVITSRRVMSKLNLELDAEVVYLEDLKDKPTTGDKIAAAVGAYVLPSGVLAATLGLGKIHADDVATVIFTSGSTGTPKGVMLTYANVSSNVGAINEVIRLTEDDVLVGVLPFFHSFGYTVTMWSVMSLNIRGAYHFDPLSARAVGQLIEKTKGTMLLATPTFLRSYLRRCKPEDLKSLDVVVAGAEKLPVELCDAFEEKFGIRPVEGYGATELSPLVSVNLPASRAGDEHRREGTVGRPVPNVRAKIVSLETGEVLPTGEPGMLKITGPNVMKGYLGREDLTSKVLHEGWYETGDVALLDADGFIKITGRQSRFSKIG
ncbi:MAG: AMP-binding protein, partial [Planctomycetales bacterium]|nr:AMP-binding protein [Planctomycetales bacterium]